MQDLVFSLHNKNKSYSHYCNTHKKTTIHINIRKKMHYHYHNARKIYIIIISITKNLLSLPQWHKTTFTLMQEKILFSLP